MLELKRWSRRITSSSRGGGRGSSWAWGRGARVILILNHCLFAKSKHWSDDDTCLTENIVSRVEFISWKSNFFEDNRKDKQKDNGEDDTQDHISNRVPCLLYLLRITGWKNKEIDCWKERINRASENHDNQNRKYREHKTGNATKHVCVVKSINVTIIAFMHQNPRLKKRLVEDEPFYIREAWFICPLQALSWFFWFFRCGQWIFGKQDQQFFWTRS